MDEEEAGPAEVVPKLQAAKVGYSRVGSIYILETEDGALVKIGYR